MDPRLMIGPNGPQLGGAPLKQTNGKAQTNSGLSFNELFNNVVSTPKTDSLRLSAHAKKRLDERNIIMGPQLENSLNDAINELSAKGAKDSLVVTKEGAFLVNVPSRTLVTAMGTEEMRDGIVTKIDSVSMKYS